MSETCTEPPGVIEVSIGELDVIPHRHDGRVQLVTLTRDPGFPDRSSADV